MSEISDLKEKIEWLESRLNALEDRLMNLKRLVWIVAIFLLCVFVINKILKFF